MVIRNPFALLISSSCVCSANFPYHPSASIQINLSVCILLIFPIFLSFWSSPQTISNSQLHVLPHFHLCPIYLVLFKGFYSFIRMGYLILGGTSRLDAFSVYSFRTWLPGDAIGMTAGTPVVRPARSSRTKASSPQISYARAG